MEKRISWYYKKSPKPSQWIVTFISNDRKRKKINGCYFVHSFLRLKYTELSILKFPMKLLFSCLLRKILSGLPSLSKAVILHKSSQNPESLPPNNPTPSQASIKRGSTSKYIQSQSKQQNCPVTKRLKFLDFSHLSSWKRILLNPVTHTELTEAIEENAFRKNIYVYFHIKEYKS